MIGHSFGTRSRGIKRLGSDLDPATLPLTGWWRAASGGEYNGSPWAGTASAGTSGSNALSEATNPPTAGTPLNAHPPADFDGTDDVLTTGTSLDTFAAGAALSGWILVNIDAISTSDGLAYNNDCIIKTNAGADFVIGLSSTGPTVQMAVNDSGIGIKQVTRAITTGAWALITFRCSSTAAEIGVNEPPGASGGGSTTAFALFATLARTVLVANNPDVTNFYDGKIAELAFTDTVLSDATFNQVKAYINSRYGLAL